MDRVKLTTIILFILSFGALLNAQNVVDTSIILSDIEITENRNLVRQIGGNTLNFETQELSESNIQSLSDLLESQSNIYIKSYGQGGISSSSIQGGNGSQTALLWNGIPIQNAMLSLSDLSLLPIHAIEEIHIQKGGNSALWGSGAIGGVINLSNKADFRNNTSVISQSLYGDFGLFSQNLMLSFGNKRFQSRTKVFSLSANNDFNYTIDGNNPIEKKQSNAAQKSLNLLQDIYWKLDSNNQLSLNLWLQNSERQFPPTIVQNQSLARQDDQSFRSLLDWKTISKRGIRNIKLGFIEEHLNYFDELIGLSAPSHFRSFYSELSQKWEFEKQHFLLAASYNNTKAWTNNYLENAQEEQISLIGSWNYNWSRWQANLSLRQVLVNQQWQPFIPAIALNFDLNKQWWLNFKLSRNYRLPGLNDRFWVPGGNGDLLAESGWAQDIALNHESRSNQNTFGFGLSAYNKHIDNWILWGRLPQESFFSAHNLTKVWSRGLELSARYDYQLNKYRLKLNSSYSYTLSTNQLALESPNIAAGQQLPYTPRHKLHLGLSNKMGPLELKYNHIITGQVSGFNETVSQWQLADVTVSYSKELNKIKGSLFFQINNLWDEDYFVIERRPMPGRNYQVGLNILFKKNNNE